MKHKNLNKKESLDFMKDLTQTLLKSEHWIIFSADFQGEHLFCKHKDFEDLILLATFFYHNKKMYDAVQDMVIMVEQEHNQDIN
jgi:hypothetical protein